MKKSIGIEKSVLVRDAMPAFAPRAAAAGFAWPPDATVFAFAITTCCAGQITNQTFAHIIVTISQPVRKVIIAPQRNHQSAFGTRPRVIAPFAVPPSSLPKKGVWTKLK